MTFSCLFACFSQPQMLLLNFQGLHTWLYLPLYFLVFIQINTGKIQLRLEVLQPDINCFLTTLTPTTQHIVMDCLCRFALYTPSSQFQHTVK